MRRYPQIIGMLVNRPLYAHPRTAVTFFNALAGRIGTGEMVLPLTPAAEVLDANAKPEARRIKASQFEGQMVRTEGEQFPRVEPFMLSGDTAIITVDGEMVNRGAWVGADSGLVSYEGVGFQLDRARKSKKVSSAVLDINTPGGAADGMPELAAKVRAFAAEKPILAIGNSLACSAGYGIACGATRVFNTPSGVMGSIGCVMLHLDMSGAMAQEGVVPTLIYSGDEKTLGTSAHALSDDDKAALQAECDSFYEVFIDTVAAGRGRALGKKAARETQARTYMGASAVEAGLADGVATFDEVLAEASRLGRRAASKSKSSSRSAKMEPEFTQAQMDEAVRTATERGQAQGREEGRKIGATEATKRIADILATDSVKDRRLAALEVATEHPEMSVEGVVKLAGRMQPDVQPPARSEHEDRRNNTGAQVVQAGDYHGQHGDHRDGGQQGGQAAGDGLSWKEIQDRKAAGSRRAAR